MKKVLQALFILSLLPIAAIGQTIHLFGTVTQDDVPVANTNVYAVDHMSASSDGDTLGIAITNSEGLYGMDLQADENDSLIVWLSTDACPDTVGVFYLAGPQSLADFNCVEETNYQTLNIGAQATGENDMEWYFISSITSDVASYTWSIDGQNFTTGSVTYTFPEAGTYEIGLTVLLNNGVSYYANLSLVVGSTGSGGGLSNCQSLFYPVTDSIADGAVYFVNSSLGTNLTYLWDFGDGTTSTEAYPNHTFADDEATYNVCLTISGTDCDQQYCTEVNGGLDGSGLIVNGEKPQEDLMKSGTFDFIVLPVYSSPTGVDEVNALLNMTLFPNPSTGNVNVQLDLPAAEKGVINITDITGKIVLQKPVSGTSSLKTVTVNMDKLADGTYLLQYKGKSISTVQKVILQR